VRRYRTVVPFHNLRLDGNVPFHLASNIWFDAIPESLRQDALLDRASEWDLQRFNICTHGLVIEYHAEALYSPDPLWKGDEPRPVEQANIELAYLANLALWLQHPSPISFTLIFHMPEYDKFIIQGTERCGGFLCHPYDNNERISPQDLEPAKLLFTALTKVPRETSVWTALRCTTAAFQVNGEETRYLLLWVALEALFGTSMEVKYRISQRLAFFMGKDRVEARTIYGDAKKAYDFRSRVAHGAWKSDRNSTALTATTESLLRRALTRMLLDDAITQNFLGGTDKREAYLDELVFA
jgi:hypothetical protein